MKPIRIQRKRTKGWRMPPNTIYVGRPTEFGNPYKVGRDGNAEQCVKKYQQLLEKNIWSSPNIHEIRKQLKGKNLACFCSLNQPCHADILLKIANL